MSAVEIKERTHSLAAHDGAIFAARQSGLYRVDNKGAALSLFHSWLPNQAMPTLALAIDAGGGLMLAGIQGGVARSTDGGANWEAIPLRSPAPLVTCLAAPADFAGGGCVLAGTFEDSVFRSTDGGVTWLAVSHGLFDHSIYALALSPRFAEDGVAFAGTGSGIYRSENGGRLWRDLIMPAGDETVLSLALADCGALYAGTEANGLLRSRDEGETWETLLEAEGAVNGVLLLARGAIVAQVDDGLLISRENGASWSEVAAVNVDCMALNANGEMLLVAKADGRIGQKAL